MDSVAKAKKLLASNINKVLDTHGTDISSQGSSKLTTFLFDILADFFSVPLPVTSNEITLDDVLAVYQDLKLRGLQLRDEDRFFMRVNQLISEQHDFMIQSETINETLHSLRPGIGISREARIFLQFYVGSIVGEIERKAVRLQQGHPTIEEGTIAHILKDYQ